MVKNRLKIVKQSRLFKAVIIEDEPEDIGEYYARAFEPYLNRFEFSWLVEVSDDQTHSDIQTIRSIINPDDAPPMFAKSLDSIWNLLGRPPAPRLLSADRGLLSPLRSSRRNQLEYGLDPDSQLKLAKSLVKVLCQEKWDLMIVDKKIDRISRAIYNKKYRDPYATSSTWGGTELLVEYIKARRHFPQFVVFSANGRAVHGTDKRNHPDYVSSSDEWRYVDKDDRDWTAEESSSLSIAMRRIEAILTGESSELLIAEPASELCDELVDQYQQLPSGGIPPIDIGDMLNIRSGRKPNVDGLIFRRILSFGYAYQRDKMKTEPRHKDLCQFLLPKKYELDPEAADNFLKQYMYASGIGLKQMKDGELSEEEISWLRKKCLTMGVKFPTRIKSASTHRSLLRSSNDL